MYSTYTRPLLVQALSSSSGCNTSLITWTVIRPSTTSYILWTEFPFITTWSRTRGILFFYCCKCDLLPIVLLLIGHCLAMCVCVCARPHVCVRACMCACTRIFHSDVFKSLYPMCQKVLRNFKELLLFWVFGWLKITVVCDVILCHLVNSFKRTCYLLSVLLTPVCLLWAQVSISQYIQFSHGWHVIPSMEEAGFSEMLVTRPNGVTS
jgi:hypothetical protein